MWRLLTILAVALLLIYWRRRNAVWGGMTAGVVLGFVAATVWFFIGHGFHWPIIWKWAVVCTLLGATTELLRPKRHGDPGAPR